MPLPLPNDQVKSKSRPPSGMDAMSVKVDDMLEGLDVLKQHCSNTIAFQSRMDEKMAAMDAKLSRVEKTLFGNGDPGVGEQLRAHDKRLTSIEAFENGCEIKQLLPLIDDMKERHAIEDEKAEKVEQVKIQTQADQRKFYIAIGTVLVTTLIDVVVHLLKLR
jgi:hypothetical protein